MKEDKTYTVPDVFFVYKNRSGFIFSLIRKFGRIVIKVGSFIDSLGYEKNKIYPRKSLDKLLSPYKAKK